MEQQQVLEQLGVVGVVTARCVPATTEHPLLGQAEADVDAGDTTSLTKLQSVKGPIPVTASNHTGCLVLFQQGKADAITGDDIVLAGLAAQDPNTLITSAKAITVEPYGLGFNKNDVYLARYVNRVLADLVADGQWKAIYNRWLAEPIGPAPAPPTPVYGR